MNPLLTTNQLAIGYPRRGGDAVVCSGIDLRLEPGQLVCLLGPNGAGKSTLLRTLAGLQPMLSGRVTLGGDDLATLDRRELARRLAVVLTERRLPGLMTARELVGLGRHPFTDWSGRLAEDDRRAVDDALDLMGASDLAERPVGQLSDGERQKVVIARALAQDPRVLVLDEPTAFLDLPRRVALMRRLRELARRTGKAVALSTHDLDLALRSADRLWLLPPGGPLVVGGPEDLVLEGRFERAFADAEVDFDRETGAFRIHPHTSGSAAVEGAGPEAAWAARALQREGFRVVNQGEAPVRVTVTRDDEGAVRWVLDDEGGRRAFDSLTGLADAVRAGDRNNEPQRHRDTEGN